MIPTSSKSARPAVTSLPPVDSVVNKPVAPRVNTSPLLTHGRALLNRSDASELSVDSLNPFRPLTTLPSSSRSLSTSLYSQGSRGSSTASVYLSPPASERDETEAPPYRPNADDRVSLNMTEGFKRGKKARRKSSRRWQSEDRVTDALGEDGRTPRRRRRRSQFSIRVARDPSAADQPKFVSRSRRSSTTPNSASYASKESTAQGKRRGSWWWRLRTSTAEEEANFDQTASKSQIRGNWLRTVQPTTDLRIQDSVSHSGFSETIYTTNTRRCSTICSTIQDGTAAIPSFTTAFAPPPLSEKVLRQDSDEGNNEHLTIQGSDRSSQRKARGRRKGDEMENRYIESPATITLRRASGVPKRGLTKMLPYSFTIQPWLQDAMDDVRKSGPPLPSTGLQSPHRSKSPTSTVYSNAMPPHFRPYPAGTGNEENLIRSRQREADEHTEIPTLPRQILIAEPVTTFTHVQVATPIVTESISGSEASSVHRRLSATQTVQARSSVYEIIWNDNDSYSSFDLSDQTTPKPDTAHIPSSDMSSLDRNPDELSGLTFDNPAFDLVYYGGNSGPMNSAAKQDKAFAEWGWTNKRRRSLSRTTAINTEVDRSINTSSNTFTVPKEEDGRPTPVLVVQSVQSFPPLLDRRSTQDWITPCLIDLNDPKAGRDCDYKASSSPFAAEISTSDSLDAQMRIASLSSVPTILPTDDRGSSVQSSFSAPQQLADKTQFGYALGASSGMRRRSVQIPWNRSARRLSFTTGANPLATSPTSTHANPLLMLSDATTSRGGGFIANADLVASHTNNAGVRSCTRGLERRESEAESYPSMDVATDSSEVPSYEHVSSGTRTASEAILG
ncbi:MAG: hypothetical protein M1835_004618 [Candelina submexicana]|nr:MAG: hypothetical protein M1835_004618 [Candelina submexicana]